MLQDVWSDIPPISAQAQERMGYPTQKPLALLERIIATSSKEGDVVLDPFCGCGTAVHAAHKLGRQWIGIDITWLAIALMKRRLESAFAGITINEVGSPRDMTSAKALAQSKPQQFEYWAVDRLDARPTGGKGPRLDGVKPFIEFGGKISAAVISVKGTSVANPEMIRELIGVLSDECPIGILVTLTNPTKGMITAAAAAGSYESGGKRYPRAQIISVEDLLHGRRPELPTAAPVFPQAQRERPTEGEQPTLI